MRQTLIATCCVMAVCIAIAVLHAQPASTTTTEQLTPIQLPAPQTEGGMPLMQALKARRSTRQFSDKKLPPQVLSNLLWAAWGVNR
ncbi:MAG: nitroreductase family protein, partial [Sedimentisphaerales bacterium]|nr:nitroreductase family protein [Sedimentisphaerales bacterium]